MYSSRFNSIGMFMLLVAICCFNACENDKGAVKKSLEKGLGKDVATQVKVQYSVQGKKKAILTGPQMFRVQDTVTYIEFPKTVHVDFYDLKDSIESVLDAKYARYNDGQSKITLRDSVRIVNILGDTLYCEELFWDRNKLGEEFFTDKPVRIRRKTEIIDGIGLTARQDFKEWMIVKPVGILKVPKSSYPAQ